MENIVRAASRKSQAKDKQSNQSIIVDLFILVVKMNKIGGNMIEHHYDYHLFIILQIKVNPFLGDN